MDAVPYTFVDSVVELFDGKKTLNLLAEELTHSLWKAAVNVHRRNREYYTVYVREKDSATHLVAFHLGTNICSDLKPIQKNRRFARIVTIYDQTDDHHGYLKWDHAQILGDVDAAKKLNSIASQIEQSSYFSYQSADIMLSSLSNRVFGAIWLHYNGQTSLTFLEQQILNSPFLERIELEAKIDISFVEKFFDHWMEKGTLNFTLQLSDVEDCQTLLKRGEVTEFRQGHFRSVIKHETAKSIAIH
uniref:FBA_2 domain-containing protein n=1 Tax=Steinernema glaseri TaxID=37863 RepID=A0A1I7Z6R6_9BILA